MQSLIMETFNTKEIDCLLLRDMYQLNMNSFRILQRIHDSPSSGIANMSTICSNCVASSVRGFYMVYCFCLISFV